MENLTHLVHKVKRETKRKYIFAFKDNIFSHNIFVFKYLENVYMKCCFVFRFYATDKGKNLIHSESFSSSVFRLVWHAQIDHVVMYL